MNWPEIEALRLQLSERYPHNYLVSLGDPLSLHEVEALEQELGQFPADYRHFVTTFGRGHAPSGSNGLCQPCWVHRDAELMGEFLFEDTLNQAEFDQWFAELGGKIFDGCICIASMGCGTIALLVTRGKATGTMWIDLTASDGGFIKAAESFRRWYADELILLAERGF